MRMVLPASVPTRNGPTPVTPHPMLKNVVSNRAGRLGITLTVTLSITQSTVSYVGVRRISPYLSDRDTRAEFSLNDLASDAVLFSTPVKPTEVACETARAIAGRRDSLQAVVHHRLCTCAQHAPFGSRTANAMHQVSKRVTLVHQSSHAGSASSPEIARRQ
jgi:hypothetical protein